MGRSVVYITCKVHRNKGQPRSTMEKFVVYMLESTRLLIHPLDEACVIFDLRGCGLKSMDIGIQFARNETDLLKYVDADHLLDTFGGKVESKITDYVGAVAGENERMRDRATGEALKQKWRAHLWKLEALLREWVGCQESETKDSRAEAVIDAELEQVAKDIRVAYFRMRPYFRAKTMYDRLPHRPLQDDGTVEWTYPHVI
ncbi:hypothetical protein BGZ67_007121 [Mortierella alpina]|nr:hypothetical protein BGZ67_007121 [Mortierella alpina]